MHGSSLHEPFRCWEWFVAPEECQGDSRKCKIILGSAGKDDGFFTYGSNTKCRKNLTRFFRHF